MNLDQMHYFTIVAQLENVSKAAESLHMTQSSLSKNILKLEEEIGTPLFDRRGKKLVLNEQGSRFLETCTKALREVEEAKKEIRLSLGESGQKIRIAMCGDISRVFACMAAFQKDNPGAAFDVDTQVEYQEYLDINDFDVIVYPDESRFRKFRGFDLGTENYYLAQPKGLSSPPRFVFLQEDGRAEFVYQIFSSLENANRDVCFVNSREAHLAMIASGMAVGFVPDGLKELYENRHIKVAQAPDERYARKLKICFKREKHLSPTAAGFCAFAMRFFQIGYSNSY